MEDTAGHVRLRGCGESGGTTDSLLNLVLVSWGISLPACQICFENICGSVACQRPLAQIFVPSVVLSPACRGESPGSFTPYDCRVP